MAEPVIEQEVLSLFLHHRVPSVSFPEENQTRETVNITLKSDQGTGKDHTENETWKSDSA